MSTNTPVSACAPRQTDPNVPSWSYITSLDEFNSLLQETASTGIPMVLDMTATWCPPCKRIGPIFEAMADEPDYLGKVMFRKLDVDETREVTNQLEVKAYPTFLMFKNGEEVERFAGASEEKLRAMVDNHK